MMKFYPPADVVGVCSASEHNFSKQLTDKIKVIEGLGVNGDCHSGKTIQHRSRVLVDPNQPNLRQVHLLQIELLEELDQKGFEVNPGDLGENITTRGINLLELGRDTLLKIGSDVVLSVTGLRNPCAQIEEFQPGLLNEMVSRKDGTIIRKAGIMSVALSSGIVSPGDPIEVFRPEGQHVPLDRV